MKRPALVIAESMPDNSIVFTAHPPGFMGLFVFGINHHTAPVALREQVAFDANTLSTRLNSLCTLPDVDEALILSTCNRTEIYCEGGPDTERSVLGWMRENANRSDELLDCLYVKEQDEVVEHVCRVAVGLDSLILGEPQILGQLKTAFRDANSIGTVGPSLHRLLPHAFAVAKRIRTQTAIGVASTSAASASIQLAQQVFGQFSDKHALMIGAGEMIEIAANHLAAHDVGAISIANRSEERARALAKRLGGRAYGLDTLDTLLPKADLIFSSTASPDPVVSADAIRRALDARRSKPMFIVDLAVPRDIDPDCVRFQDVFLYTIDDLHQAVDENLDARRAAAADAERIIAEHIEQYARHTEGLTAAPIISAMHARSNDVKRELVELATKQLVAGKSPEETLQWLADRLASRLLHRPSVVMREAAEAADEQTLDAAQRLFNQPKERE
ncbi:MAG: glutamyl-tRNA reductase [Pseudomonadota bacterium]